MGSESFIFNYKTGVVVNIAFFSFITLINIVIFLTTVIRHLRNLKNKSVQLRYFVILGIVPVYSITSLISLAVPVTHMWTECAKKAYEAVLLFTFLTLMVTVVGGQGKSAAYISMIHRDHPIIGKVCPFLWLNRSGSCIVLLCYFMAAQFIIMVPILTLAATILDYFDLYDDGVWAYNKGFVYIKCITTLSTSAAVTALFLFYLNTKKALATWNPLYKFLAIKLIIFVPVVQEIVLKILISKQLKKMNTMFEADVIANGVNNVLIITEMFFAGLMLAYAYSHTESTKYGEATSKEETSLVSPLDYDSDSSIPQNA